MTTKEKLLCALEAAGFKFDSEAEDRIYDGVMKALSSPSNTDSKQVVGDQEYSPSSTVILGELFVAVKPKAGPDLCSDCHFFDRPYSFCELVMENPKTSCSSYKRPDGFEVIWIKAEK